MDGKIDVAKYILGRVNDIMSFQSDGIGDRLRWFYCFGTLQEYIADFDINQCTGGFGIDYDIDVGVVYGECQANNLIKSFEDSGFKCVKKFLNDITKEPLNLHFVSTDIKEAPSVDVYFWVKKKNIWYHTYDRGKEGKKIPSKYTFKGIEFNEAIGHGFFAPKKTIERIHTKNPLGRQFLSDRGVWMMDVFERDSSYKFYAPYSYGYCLDTWYDNWKYRKFNNLGESKTPIIKTVRSCREL